MKRIKGIGSKFHDFPSIVYINKDSDLVFINIEIREAYDIIIEISFSKPYYLDLLTLLDWWKAFDKDKLLVKRFDIVDHFLAVSYPNPTSSKHEKIVIFDLER
jgi:hypothetical protein